MRSLFLCLLLTACDSTSATDHTAACKALATARCAKLNSCSAFDMQQRYASMDECQTHHTQSCVNSFAAPQSSNTDTRVSACATALTAQACGDFLANSVPDACQANVGPRANGQPCAFAGQCASSYCGIVDGTNCGSCADQPKAGDACGDCGTHGLVCSGGVCAAPIASAAACTRQGVPCVTGYSCVAPPGMMMMGTCQAQLATAGATCDPTRRNAPDCSRDAGLVCNPTTCVAITLAAAGAACGSLNSTLCADGNCYGSGMMAAGACKAHAADGAACDDTNGPSCTSPARCIHADGSTTGTCALAGSQSCG